MSSMKVFFELISIVLLSAFVSVTVIADSTSNTGHMHIAEANENNNDNNNNEGYFTWEDHGVPGGSRRKLIEDGQRTLTEYANEKCTDIINPCGPESICTQVDETSYICENEFVRGCVAGCGPNSFCTLGTRGFYYCKCNDGYYQPQRFMPCRLKSE